MASSEQFLVPTVVSFTCAGWKDEELEIPCTFDGSTDEATFDPETNTAQWSCEECGTQYAEPRER